MEPKLDYLIRFSHDLESFRVAEIEALALIEGVDMEILRYNAGVSFLSTFPPILSTVP